MTVPAMADPGYRPLDVETVRAVLVGATPQQRALLRGAGGDQQEVDAAQAAAQVLFCRVLSRVAPTPGCRPVCRAAPAFVRGTLAGRDRQTVAAHVDACPACAWMVDLLPGLADSVRSVAARSGDVVIGPPEGPDAPQRVRVGTARRSIVVLAAAAVLGVAGVGVAAAQGGWWGSGTRSAVVDDGVGPVDRTVTDTAADPLGATDPLDATDPPDATDSPGPAPQDPRTGTDRRAALTPLAPLDPWATAAAAPGTTTSSPTPSSPTPSSPTPPGPTPPGPTPSRSTPPGTSATAQPDPAAPASPAPAAPASPAPAPHPPVPAASSPAAPVPAAPAPAAPAPDPPASAVPAPAAPAPDPPALGGTGAGGPGGGSTPSAGSANPPPAAATPDALRDEGHTPNP